MVLHKDDPNKMIYFPLQTDNACFSINFQQFQTEINKLEEEEGPTDRDLENTDKVIRDIDQKMQLLK